VWSFQNLAMIFFLSKPQSSQTALEGSGEASQFRGEG
jgi:hypothetical protein